jgi:hypothetical protein
MQGLDKNRYQFALLVLVNAFVGAMLGRRISDKPCGYFPSVKAA